MISKTQIKYLNKLLQKKYRKQYGEFVIEGKKIVSDALNSSLFTVKKIWATADVLRETVVNMNIPIEEITGQEARQISSLKHSEGIFALVEIPEHTDTITEGPVLLLDFIQDPGNLGTIIRTADWFGFKTVICSPNTVDVYNPKTIQAAKGSIFHIPVVYSGLSQWINSHRQFTYYATVLNGENIHAIKFSPATTALIIGNEANGISEEIRQLSHYAVSIQGKGQAESLNAAIATAICCFCVNG